MLKTRRRRWLLAGALFFLAAAGIAIAQVVTAQGEEASGVRHIVRTNASGELIVAGSGAPTEVEGTTADGAAFSDNPVIVGGVSGGDASQLAVTATGVVATGVNFTAADGVSNTLFGLPQTITGGGGGWYQGIWPYQFNGATWDRNFVCTESAPITLAVAAYTEIIAAAAGETIRICHISLSSDAAMDLTIYEGTGADCVVGTAALTGVYEDVNALALDFGSDAALRASASQAVCLHLVAAANAGGVITYAQF